MDFSTYDKKCEIILKLIRMEFPNLEIARDVAYNHYMVIVFKGSGHRGKITISPDDKWDGIKDRIETALNNKRGTCKVCDEEIKVNATCNSCQGNYCMECYINIFRENKGMIVCPYCNYTFGIKTPNNMIEACITNIREKARFQ